MTQDMDIIRALRAKVAAAEARAEKAETERKCTRRAYDIAIHALKHFGSVSFPFEYDGWEEGFKKLRARLANWQAMAQGEESKARAALAPPSHSRTTPMADAPAKSKRPLRIRSGFAILDVLSARDGELYRRVAAGEDIPVVVRGRLVNIHGNHDGESREYQIDVASVEVVNG